MASRVRSSATATPAPLTRSRHTRDSTAAVPETPRTAISGRRSRLGTAAPSSVSRAGPSTVSRSTNISSNAPAATTLPEYQLPSHALNEIGMEKLARLLQEHKVDRIDEALKKATQLLTDSAQDINERFMELQGRHKGKRKRDQNENVDDEEARTEDAKLQETKDKVDNMTKRMDEGLRKVIDGHAGLDALDKAVEDVQKRAKDAVVAEEARKKTEGKDRAAAEAEAASTQAQTQRSAARFGEGDSDNEVEDETLRTPNATVPGTRPQTQTQTQRTFELPNLPNVLTTRIDNLMTVYTSRTLLSRYAGHNDYANLKKAVHTARHAADEKVPLPAPRTWFAAEEEPEPGMTQPAAGGDEDDDDIAVSRQTVATRCPITLREFEDPVTSNKCDHSFEREAIVGMIHQQPRTAPGPRRRGQPSTDIAIEQIVRCPVSGCDSMLREEDLRDDPVLVRRIKRIQKARELAAEEGQSESGGGMYGDNRRTTEGVTEIESGDENEDGMDIDELEGEDGPHGRTPAAISRIKAERATQSQRYDGSGVEDIEDD